MQQFDNPTLANLSRVLKLNEKALEYARENDWEAALACISKRHDDLMDLFQEPQDFLLNHREKIVSMTEQVETADKQLTALASDARVDFGGKIAHLSLQKKASSAYQEIASQR